MTRRSPGSRPAGLGVFFVCAIAWRGTTFAGAPQDPKAPPTTVSELRALAAKGAAGVPGLTAALADGNAPIRAAAVQLLASVKGREAIPLIAPLTEDEDDSVAVAAVGALLALGGEGTLEPVRKAFASKSSRVRTQAAAYVGDARDARFVKDLGALLSDETPGVRRSAVEALRATGGPGTFPFLMAATGDRAAEIAASAVTGLATLGDVRALPRIAQLASSEDPAVRGAVAHAIPVLGGVGSYGPAFHRLVGDPQRSVRLEAAAGLRDAPSAESAAALAKLSHDADPVVRRAAVQAWRAQALPGASAALAELARDGDENVRATAVLALGFRRAKDQADAVAALATDPSERVREAVAATLGDLGRRQDLGTLGTMATDGAAGVRAAAVVAAALIGTTAALPIVDRGTTDADPLVRLEAVRALGLLDRPESLERLRALAAEGDLNVRVAAIDQLGARKDRGSIPLLRKIAQDPVESLRNAARRALEAIGA